MWYLLLLKLATLVYIAESLSFSFRAISEWLGILHYFSLHPQSNSFSKFHQHSFHSLVLSLSFFALTPFTNCCYVFNSSLSLHHAAAEKFKSPDLPQHRRLDSFIFNCLLCGTHGKACANECWWTFRQNFMHEDSTANWYLRIIPAVLYCWLQNLMCWGTNSMFSCPSSYHAELSLTTNFVYNRFK